MLASAMHSIEKFLRSPPETSRVVTIDPATAQAILEQRNQGNRPPKPNKVQQFASDISQKNWGLTGDTIKFGNDGRLLDGQNRLAACVRANRAFTTHVVFNIDPQLFGRMDIGKPRNAADILHIAGYKYASTLAAAARWAHLLDTNPYDRETLKPEFVLQLVRGKYADIQDCLKEGRNINRQYAHPAGQIAALVYAFRRRDGAKAKDFVRAWLSGQRDGKYHVIDNMQSVLHTQKANNNGRIHELTRAAVIVKAWNLFSHGHKGSLAQLKAAIAKPIETIG